MKTGGFKGWVAIVGMIGLVGAIGYGLMRSGPLLTWTGLEPTSQVQGEVFGAIPKPTQPSLREPVLELVKPASNLQKMLVKHIPPIDPGAKMPHPSWGPCTQCHLFRGGPPPGSQPATPVAKVWEQISVYYKVGPPILPNSARPHPPSGRCIKCHDVLVYVQTK